MEKTAAEIQKERIKLVEAEADALLERCSTVTLASVNEKGYPRICTVNKAGAKGFREIYAISSKRSKLAGKVTHFERDPRASICFSQGGDSVTLVGVAELVSDRALCEELWNESDRRFFPMGPDDPKFRLIRFRAIEATFWIGGKFRTCKYSLTPKQPKP